MTTARTPKVRIIYAGKDISEDLSLSLVSVNYTDKVVGETDDLSFTVEDTDGRWRNEWWPKKGDMVKLRFGYDDLLVDSGEFKVDEIEVSGPPDIVTIKGLATWTTTTMRTKVSKAYEGQTLKQIAQAIAAKNGLTVEGTILNIRLERSTQNQETDLEYLKRVANEFGYQFSVKGTKLVFVSVFDIEKGEPVLTIDRTDLIAYSLRDKSFETYKKASVKYHNPKDRTLYLAEVDSVDNAGGNPFREPTAEDTLEIRTKAENKEQAEIKAKVALYRSRAKQVEGSLTVEGNPLLVAGNNFELTDMGELSGKWHIMQSTHTFDKSGGYTTDIEIKRVGYVQKDKKKSNRKPRKQSYTVSVIE